MSTYLPTYKPKHKMVKSKKTGRMMPSLETMFNRGHLTSKDATKNGRIHCCAVQRTAIMRDNQGNQVILKENQTIMNTPREGANVKFNHGRHTWRKKR